MDGQNTYNWPETNNLGLLGEQEQSDDSASIKTSSDASSFEFSLYPRSQPAYDTTPLMRQAHGEPSLAGHQDLIPSDLREPKAVTSNVNSQQGSLNLLVDSDLPQSSDQQISNVAIRQKYAGRPKGMPNRKPKGKGKPFVVSKWTERKKKGLDGRSLATNVGPSDEDVRGQPDIRYLDQSLIMALDGPVLRQIIRRIEADDTLCFKMRWYVARHVRKNFKKSIAPGSQEYTVQVRGKASYLLRRRLLPPHSSKQHDGAAFKLGGKPLDRLDFEATRVTAGFRKDQPGWEDSDFTRVLQMAYEKEGWGEFVTDADVDDVLRRAGADLDAFTNAHMITDRSPTPPQVSSDLALMAANLAQLKPGKAPRGGGGGSGGGESASKNGSKPQVINAGEPRKRGRPSKSDISRVSVDNADIAFQALYRELDTLKKSVAQERQARELMAAEMDRMRQAFRDELRRERAAFGEQIAELRATAVAELLEEQNEFHAALAADHETFQREALAEIRRLRVM